METASLSADFAALTGRLDPARAIRARAYGDTPAGRRCLAAGLLLRAVLGAGDYRTGANGKPTLDGAPPFNLSHAGDYAVLITGERDVGVDIERVRPIDCMRIAARFFHPDEYAYLKALPDPLDAFFSIWTLKESYGKATGRGFSLAPSSFCILPAGADGAVFAGETSCVFRRYDRAFPGYRLSACAAQEAFPDEIAVLDAADAR